jgi:hypothetical protein
MRPTCESAARERLTGRGCTNVGLVEEGEGTAGLLEERFWLVRPELEHGEVALALVLQFSW